jgi:membrane-associated phospholipid phosphatase
VRLVAAATLVGAAALPVARKRLRGRGIPNAAILAGSALAPASAAVLWARGPRRAVPVCALQMHAYIAAYKMPHDDEAGQAARVHVGYPIVLDRLLGGGELPTVRLQRALHRDGRFRRFEKALVWAHWVWFATPQASVAYVYRRRRSRFARAAVMTYAVFDIGAIGYWALPTAPPWYASQTGRLAGDGTAVRRLMVEYGEQFWGPRWDALYAALGGNPLGAMPSLHFATATMGMLLLAETGPVAGAVGGAYAATLGFALVYLGEHYVVDLLAGLALTLAVRRLERVARPPLHAAGAVVDRVARFAEGRDGVADGVVAVHVRRLGSPDGAPGPASPSPVARSQPQWWVRDR